MTDKDDSPAAPDALPAKPDRIADLIYFLRSRDLEIPEFHAMQLEIADALAALTAERDTAIADADNIKQVEFPRKLYAVTKTWRDRAVKAEAALAERDKDAERYRWLRDIGDSHFTAFAKRMGYSAAELDSHIDAALAKEKD